MAVPFTMTVVADGLAKAEEAAAKRTSKGQFFIMRSLLS
jgi:hypothetical protein